MADKSVKRANSARRGRSVGEPDRIKDLLQRVGFLTHLFSRECGFRSGVQLSQDLGCVPDKTGAQGAKEVVLDRFVSSLLGAHVRPE